MRTWAVAMLLIAGAGAARSESLEMGAHGGLFNINGTNLGRLTATPDQILTLQNGWRIGFRISINPYRLIGHEIFYAYNRTTLRYEPAAQEQGMAIHQGGYNLVMHLLPERSPVRPFITGGGHFSNFVPPGATATYGGGSTKFGGNWGGGVKIKVAPSILLRLDFRDYIQPKPFGLPEASGAIHLIEYSVGISLAI